VVSRSVVPVVGRREQHSQPVPERLPLVADVQAA
jgi:hypothetical protein